MIENTPLLIETSERIMLFVMGMLGCIIFLVIAAVNYMFEPGEEEEEENSRQVEIASGTKSSYNGGRSSIGNTIQGEFTHNASGGISSNAQVGMGGPVEEKYTREEKLHSTSNAASTQCTHCGAINKKAQDRCWNCGSSPKSTLSQSAISRVNERVQEGALDNSYVVRKGEEPAPHPAPSPGSPLKNKDSAAERERIEKQKYDEEIPIWRYWLGSFFGWIDKWKAHTSTHMRSMILVTLIAGFVWGIGLVYGAARFGTSGFLALVGASLIAILSASLAVLFILTPGEAKTILLGYPFALNVIFLPPLVIALYEPVLQFTWVYSEIVAAWILDTFLSVGGLNNFLRSSYDMSQRMYIVMWFVISHPLGWTIGTTVYLSKRYGPLVNDLVHSRNPAEDGNEDPSKPNKD